MGLDMIDLIQEERFGLICKSLNGDLSDEDAARLDMLDKALVFEKSVFYGEYDKNTEKLCEVTGEGLEEEEKRFHESLKRVEEMMSCPDGRPWNYIPEKFFALICLLGISGMGFLIGFIFGNLAMEFILGGHFN